MPSEPLQFAQRAHLSEWMDGPCDYAEFRDCLRDLSQVNRTVFSYRPTLAWLDRIACRNDASCNNNASCNKDASCNNDAPLHIVDVGSGGGDMLRRIESWAARRNVPVRLTGIDRNPFAARAAREFGSATSRIEWLSCDAFGYRPSTRIDLILSSLFTHHLSDAEIVRFLQWMEQTATRGWFVNDLRRERTPYYAFMLLAHAMRWHRFVRHDGPISVRRGFRPHDWRRYVNEAGLAADAVSIFDAWPGRLCVARVK